MDLLQHIFYDPADGLSVRAIVLSFFLVLIAKEVASEVTTSASPKGLDISIKEKGTVKGGCEESSEITKETEDDDSIDDCPQLIESPTIPDPPPEPNTIVKVPEGETVLRKRAYYGSETLKSIEFPSSLTKIDDFAFYWCTKLTKVTIPEGLETIGAGAFAGCSGLTSIDLPSTLKSIDHLAFCDCTGLTTVHLPDGLQTIGQDTFRNCTNLAVQLPHGCSLKF